MMKQILLFTSAAVLVAHVTEAAIRVSPSEVNVSSQGATTVFLTFGGLTNQAPAEGLWCGALVPAAPDIGSRCDPARTWGRLPLRFDQSRPSGTNGFTDIMSITPSSAHTWNGGWRRSPAADRQLRPDILPAIREYSSTGRAPRSQCGG